MSRIIYQTDNWGNVGEDHIEFTWQGVTMFLTITDEMIKIVGAQFLDVDHSSVNSVTLRPSAEPSLLTPATPPKNIKGPFKNKPPKGFT
ncbi:MAG TPA: hypothetical protein VFZ66_29645 [Herpetosiphonaceae bacterium]